MSDTQILTRKVQLVPVGDKDEVNRVYKYLRDGMKAQNLAMNQYMSALYLAALTKMPKEDKKELYRLFGRVSDSKLGSAYDSSIEFAKGLDTPSNVNKKVKNDFDNAIKDILRGKSSLPTYKKDNPLLIKGRDVRLYHNYLNHEEFLNNLYNKNLELYIRFVNNITFKIILGNPKKSLEIRILFKNIFEEYYHIADSSIEIKDTKIILNMALKIPKQKIELNENIVVGVDLGIAIPAMCALNTNDYIKLSIGSRDDFLRVRTQIKNQRSRLNSSLKFAKGGHGRKRKLKALDRFSSYEKNWVQNYNHMVSKRVIDFALKNKAKYINLECLKGISQETKNTYLLRYWSYYQLQQYITYKAEKYGIIVRYIKPYHTSQNCSCCGHWEKGQRVKQSEFICKNPECKNFNKIVNADFNAARNISLSTDFVLDDDQMDEDI